MTDVQSLVIGGSSGIGKATAALLAQDGRSVLIVGRDEARLDRARTEIEAAGSGAIETLSADLTTRRQSTP